MSPRFTLFIALSLLVHAGVLLWPRSDTPPLSIGGEAQALRVSIAAMSAVVSVPDTTPVHQPAARQQDKPAPRTPPLRLPAQTALQPVVPVRKTTISPDPGATASSHQTAQVTGNAPQSASSPEQSAADVSRKISVALRNRLSSRFIYPWLARQRGWEGRVLLSLTVMGNGDLGEWRVAQTSGYRTLDHSALEAAQRIENLPQAAAWLNGRSLEVQVPVQYRLLDS